MRTAIIVGIPDGYIGHAKSAVERNSGMLDGWLVKYVPSSKRSESHISEAEVARVLKLASERDDSHILGLSTQPGRQQVANQIKEYFRFRWFDQTLLRHLGSHDPSPFLHRLAADLAAEAVWVDRVKPSSVTSPLLLPECSFSTTGRHRELWRHACAYGDAENISGAQKAIEAFHSQHWRKVERRNFRQYKWVDGHDRVFHHDGARHGPAPHPRGWKYSFRIDVGFHFDVSARDGGTFSVSDHLRKVWRGATGGHINLDPHGHVRAG